MESDDAVTARDMAQLAVLRSTAYAFLGSIYNRIPDQAFVTALKDGSVAATLGALAEGEQDDLTAGLGLVQHYLTGIRDIAPEHVQTTLSVERTRILRGIQPGYGPPPPYESVYRGGHGSDLGRAARDVQQCYGLAGAGVPADLHEPADYIGLELDFLRHLTEREAQAWAAGNEAEAGDWLQQQKAFLYDHALAWIPGFCDIMEKEATLGFYRGMARITKGFLLADGGRVALLTG